MTRWLVLLALAAGCGASATTEIVLSVDTDLEVGVALKGVRISVTEPPESPLHGTELFSLPCIAIGSGAGRRAPPLTLGVYREPSATSDRFTAIARGYDDAGCQAASVVAQSATTQFVSGARALLELHLLSACLAAACVGEGRTCRSAADVCVSDEEPARSAD